MEAPWYDPTLFVDLAVEVRNNLFRHGCLRLFSIPATAGNWVCKDNIFDKVDFFQDTNAPLDYDYNAYYPLTQAELDEHRSYYPWDTPNFSHWQVTTPVGDLNGGNEPTLTAGPVFQNGPLGGYYLPTSSPLYNSDKRGSRAVADAGLYHYTTRADQTKDGAQSGNVIIGRHYVATANSSSSQPKDADADGIPDFVEDANGNNDANDVLSGIETDPALFQTTSGTADSLNIIYDDIDLDGDGMVGRIEKALAKNTLVSDNPLVMTPVTAENEFGIVQFAIPINYTTLAEIGTINLFAEGHPVILDRCEAASGGNSLLTWNSAYESPGQHFLNPVLVLHGLPAGAKVASGVGQINPLFSANVAQFSATSAQFDDNGAILYARLPQINATYSVEIYDAENPGTPIKTIASGSTSDGIIEENWDLVQDGGTTVFSGEKIFVAFNVSLLDNPTSGRNVQVVNRGVIVVPDGRCDVAFMWPDYALAQPHYGAMWMHMQFAVDTLIAPYFGFANLYQSYFNDYGFTPKPGYLQTRANALSLLNDLANLSGSGTRNFYYFGHGSPQELSDGLPGPSNAYLRSSEVAAALGNAFDPVDGIKTSHPYRFVFINGCTSAYTKAWVRAFGIFPWDDGSMAQAGYRGPQAFVGWPKQVGGPDEASEWNDLPFPASPRKGYGSMIEDFYGHWMSEQPLDECIGLASDPAEYKWPLPVPSNKKIYTKPNDPTDYTAPITVVGNERITRSAVAP